MFASVIGIRVSHKSVHLSLIVFDRETSETGLQCSRCNKWFSMRKNLKSHLAKELCIPKDTTLSVNTAQCQVPLNRI